MDTCSGSPASQVWSGEVLMVKLPPGLGSGAGSGAGPGAGVPPPPPSVTVNTNCLSEWLSPPHQPGPPSGAVRSCTTTQGCVVTATVGVPVMSPLDDIDRPSGKAPLTICQR